MRTEVIKADTIEAAAQQILDKLKGDANGASRSTSGRDNVIYFDGWDGLGASAVLRTVAERLDPANRDSKVLASGLHFDQIIHIDCSKWENRRVLQREIAKHLQLPTEVMEMFDWQDEEDDIHGVAQGSRLVIPQVLREMFRRIKELNHRFLVIFHNGSREEIDLSSFGFPLSGYMENMVLWTFQGRFRFFRFLRTFWGSQLPKVRFIWNWGRTSSLFRFYSWSFQNLQILHLNLCPRLIHVLPLPMSIMDRCLLRLVALEIVWCSDLKEIFPFYYSGAESSDMQQESTYEVEFWSLKHIHLHELPRLRGICGGNARLSAPDLETIKIRGCWSLKRLPAISRYRTEKVKCDCEKEWWDMLEWDGSAWHHPDLYQPTHPRYYKKRMLRGSVLV